MGRETFLPNWTNNCNEVSTFITYVDCIYNAHDIADYFFILEDLSNNSRCGRNIIVSSIVNPATSRRTAATVDALFNAASYVTYIRHMRLLSKST